MKEEIDWFNVEEQSMPDMFYRVLVKQNTGAVFIAQYDGPDGWYSANNLPIEDPEYWAEVPNGPLISK